MNFFFRSKTIKIIFLFSLALLIISFIQQNKLPPKNEILKSVYLDPIQDQTSKSAFNIEKGGITYSIKPHYSYEINGLVVAQYDSENWLDVFHKNDLINTRDLCLVWGSNVKTDVFHKYRYKHGEFTCFLKFDGSYEDYVRPENQFSFSQISNNHLLPATQAIHNEMKKTNIGDQVSFSGYLVDYSYDVGQGEWQRTTSTTRGDEGNGACEIVYVTNFKILKRANQLWHIIFYLSLAGGGLSIILFFISLLLTPRFPKAPPGAKSKFGPILPDKITTRYK
jgi:hypothetical protein